MTHDEAVSTHAAERYLLGEMNDAERDRFEEHYFSCTLCAEEVRAGALMKEGAEKGFATEAAGGRVVPFTAPQPRSRMSVVLPWAVAASLAVVVGYQSLVTLPKAREEYGATALSPITLRPASRGNPVAVTLRPGSTNVTLAVDVPAFAGSELTYAVSGLTYTVYGPGNATVAAGAAPVPSSGSPLLLLIPARAVETPGDYRLVVKASTGGAAEEEYLFKVTAP